MTQTDDRHTKVAPELKQAVLAALLNAKSEKGYVSAADIRQARLVLMHRYTERTLWRWVQRGEVPDLRRGGWTPTPEQQQMVLTFGTVAEVRRQLKRSGAPVASERTMQRAFQAEVGAVHLTFARSGYDKAHAMTPTSAMPTRAVNEEWSMDDTQLPVWCIMPDGRIDKPQFEGIRDAGSKVIVGFTVSPYPFTAEDAVENIAKAVAGYTNDNGVFVGGKPKAMRTDRGSVFVARATGLGLVAAAIERRYSEAYVPQGNGGIERVHRTYKAMFRDVPGYDRSDFKAGDRRKAHKPPPKSELLHFAEVVALAAERVRVYNHERVHASHNMTPMQCWERDVAANPHLVRRADAVALRAAMQQRVTRKLNRRRVELNGRFYNLHPQSVHDPDESDETIAARRKAIRGNAALDVEVRFLHGRVEFVSVYARDGQYLGDGVWEEIQTVEQAGETASARRADIKTMNDHVEAMAKADAAGVEKRKAEARAEAGLREHDKYDACDEDCDDNCTGHGATDTAAVHATHGGRKSGLSKGKSRKAKAPERVKAAPPMARPLTPTERRKQQRRADQERINADTEAKLAAAIAARMQPTG